MKIKQRQFRLLSKSTFIYLIFSFLAFFGSGVFLTHKADVFIDNSLEAGFQKIEHFFVRKIKEGASLDDWQYVEIKDPAIIANLAALYPVYCDTMVYNSEVNEMQPVRKKTTAVQVDGKYYRVDLIKSVNDFVNLRNDTISALIPAFIFLAFGIVIFNYALSGYFFRPLNKILASMKSYRIGKGDKIDIVHTTTKEFAKMQNLFKQMIGRIEYDYRHLKEYTENMAHEIQTPLTIILNKAENLMADEKVMANHAESVRIIYGETTSLSKLGNTLNLITKIENGEFSNAVHLDTKPVIEKHLAAIDELVRLKNLRVETNLHDEHSFFIDPFLFDIILKNLFRNAIAYGSNTGSICVQTTSDSLVISNYGEPIGELQDRLFERFNRKNGNSHSLGLGLSLVKKICDLNAIEISHKYENDQHIFILKSGNLNGNLAALRY